MVLTEKENCESQENDFSPQVSINSQFAGSMYTAIPGENSVVDQAAWM